MGEIRNKMKLEIILNSVIIFSLILAAEFINVSSRGKITIHMLINFAVIVLIIVLHKNIENNDNKLIIAFAIVTLQVFVIINTYLCYEHISDWLLLG